MESSDMYIQEGKKLVEACRFKEAQAAFQKALGEDSKSLDARIWLARLSILEHEKKEALKLLDEVFTLEPEHAEAFAMKALLSMQDQEFQQAAELLEKAKQLRPALEMIYYNLGRSYRKLKKYEEAESVIASGLLLYPRNYLLHCELGFLQGRKGNWDDAIRSMTEAVRIQPLYWKGYLILGQLYRVNARLDIALATFQEGLTHNPYSHELRLCLCDTFALSQDFASAYREAAILATARKFYRDYLRLGMYAVLLGKPEMAEKAFRKSIDANPASWEGHFNLGELYAAAKLFPEAKEQYQQAMEKGDSHYKPFVAMGLFLLQQEQNAREAISLFERASKLAPKRIEPLLGLAFSYATLNDFPKAIHLAREAIHSSAPGDPNYTEAERLLLAIQGQQ